MGPVELPRIVSSRTRWILPPTMFRFRSSPAVERFGLRRNWSELFTVAKGAKFFAPFGWRDKLAALAASRKLNDNGPGRVDGDREAAADHDAGRAADRHCRRDVEGSVAARPPLRLGTLTTGLRALFAFDS
jgi:hypothetical protein